LALDPGVPFHHYRFDRWGVDDGLPQISVLTITQDRLGYLWVGTQNGIARFDGSRFTVYDRKSSGVDTTLASTSIATADGRVWFGTPRGMLWIQGERVHEIDARGTPIGVLDLAEDIKGQLLAASESGVYTLAGDRLQPYPLAPAPAYALQRDGAVVWVGGLGAITRLAGTGPERIALSDPALKVSQIAHAGDALWLGTQSGLKRYDLRTHALASVPDAGSEAIESLLLDSDGNLWVGTLNHLSRRWPDGRWEAIGTDDLFAQPWIDTLFEDREGALWMGSHSQSLLRLRDSAITRIGIRAGLADPFTWSVLRDHDGALLVGTNSGVMAIGNDGIAHELVGANALPQAQVYSLAEDPDGTLWIGTRSGLALRRNGTTSVPPALAPLAGLQIDAIQRVGDDDHWIGTIAGLFRYRKGVLRAIGPRGGVPGSTVRTILPLNTSSKPPDDILIGTDAGIFRVQGEHYSRLPGTEALNASFVSRLAWLRPGLLGITTMDRGLGLLRNGHMLLLGPENGLPSANGWTLDVIGAYLYVSSIDGMYRVALDDLPDPSAKPPYRLRTQVVVEGTQRGGGEHRYGCCNGGGDARTLHEGSVLWIASSSGVVRLDTTELPGPAAPPAALIERVRNGDTIFPGDSPLRVDGDSRDLEIDYTGLSLVDSNRIEFRYRLNGYDPDWRDAGTRRVAYYTHLPPGDFRFRVQARPPFGQWGAEIDPLDISVASRWYERIEIRLAALALALLLAAFTVMRHNAELRRRARDLQRAVDDRTVELREANTALEKLSRTDSLTGLANRRALDPQAPGPERNWSGAVLLIDLDHFKRVNDDHGHARGDQVIMALGDILRANTRSDDRVLRWGGEEFLIVSHRLDIDVALVLAERIRSALAEHRFRAHDGKVLHVTCSIGIAPLPVHAARTGDLDASIALADFALYRAKRDGRDRVRAVTLPSEASPGVSQGDLREEAERLDALGKLQWRMPTEA
jgi:diguanylate cyclase (GGDEF)-like protein